MPTAKKTKTLPAKSDQGDLTTSKDYLNTLAELKKRIQEAQLKAALSVNRELIRLYWHIGEKSRRSRNRVDGERGLSNNFPKICKIRSQEERVFR